MLCPVLASQTFSDDAGYRGPRHGSCPLNMLEPMGTNTHRGTPDSLTGRSAIRRAEIVGAPVPAAAPVPVIQAQVAVTLAGVLRAALVLNPTHVFERMRS